MPGGRPAVWARRGWLRRAASSGAGGAGDALRDAKPTGQTAAIQDLSVGKELQASLMKLGHVRGLGIQCLCPKLELYRISAMRCERLPRA